MTVAVGVLVAVLLLAASLSPGLHDGTAERVVAGVSVAALAALGLLAVVGGTVTGDASPLARSILVALFVVAVLGGSSVTAAMLWLVDRDNSDVSAVASAGEVLRGGAWIGRFERVAVFVVVVAGWPNGLAIVLALKGLGRYSGLRAPPGSPTPADRSTGSEPDAPEPAPAVAERFLIGTFTSVLWAAACAGTYLTLLR